MHHFQTKLVYYIECFYRTLWQPYWCSKTMKRWPCWCTKTILWASDSFLMQTLFFVPINLHRCWSHDLNRSITEHIFRDCKNEWCLYSKNLRPMEWINELSIIPSGLSLKQGWNVFVVKCMYFNDGTTMFFIDPSPQPTNSVFRTELLLCPVGWQEIAG